MEGELASSEGGPGAGQEPEKESNVEEKHESFRNIKVVSRTINEKSTELQLDDELKRQLNQLPGVGFTDEEGRGCLPGLTLDIRDWPASVYVYPDQNIQSITSGYSEETQRILQVHVKSHKPGTFEGLTVYLNQSVNVAGVKVHRLDIFNRPEKHKSK